LFILYITDNSFSVAYAGDCFSYRSAPVMKFSKSQIHKEKP
jgi:hypothetical protein